MYSLLNGSIYTDREPEGTPISREYRHKLSCGFACRRQDLIVIINSSASDYRIYVLLSVLTHHFLFFIADDVEFLLIACNVNKRNAVKRFLKQPQPHRLSEHTVVTFGVFGGHKVAFFHGREQGRDIYDPVMEILTRLQKVEKVLAIGVAYGACKERQKFGDVLVSRKIDCGPLRESEGVTNPQGKSRTTDKRLTAIFCDNAADWSKKQFQCTEEERYSEVHTGVILSASILVDNKASKDNILAYYKPLKWKFVGGEMEGDDLLRATRKVEETEKSSKDGCTRTIAPIVIKGVADYGDGEKDKKWQPIAAAAAAHYAEFMLKQVSIIGTFCLCKHTPS